MRALARTLRRLTPSPTKLLSAHSASYPSLRIFLQHSRGLSSNCEFSIKDSTMDDQNRDLPLERSLRALLDRRRANSTLRNLTISTNKTDFSSNDFLSLARSEKLKETYLQELSSSDLSLGSGGSRLLDGNSAYAEALERDIARFHGAQSGLLFNSGFDANAGFFACVPQPGDFIVYDELIHASVHDGMRLSRASKRHAFKHNCVQDLKNILKDCMKSSERLREGKAHVIIAVEAVYSMDGDLAPLKEIVDAVDEVLPKGVGYVVVDEAHSTGVIGTFGRGLVCQSGLEQRIFARLHTFGKALACNGAIILGSPLLRHYLINYARPLIYTTFLSYPALAGIRASYTLLQQGHTEGLATHLVSLIDFLFSSLHSIDTPNLKHILKVPATCPSSPIFSIQTPEPKELAKFLQDRGMMVRAVVPPTVPDGTERVRVCLHAGNTHDEIEELVKGIELWASEKLRQASGFETQSKRGALSARL